MRAALVVRSCFKSASQHKAEDPGVRRAMKPLVAGWMPVCKQVRPRSTVEPLYHRRRVLSPTGKSSRSSPQGS
jgi:hypothetical protein